MREKNEQVKYTLPYSKTIPLDSFIMPNTPIACFVTPHGTGEAALQRYIYNCDVELVKPTQVMLESPIAGFPLIAGEYQYSITNNFSPASKWALIIDHLFTFSRKKIIAEYKTMVPLVCLVRDPLKLIKQMLDIAAFHYNMASISFFRHIPALPFSKNLSSALSTLLIDLDSFRYSSMLHQLDHMVTKYIFIDTEDITVPNVLKTMKLLGTELGFDLAGDTFSFYLFRDRSVMPLFFERLIFPPYYLGKHATKSIMAFVHLNGVMDLPPGITRPVLDNFSQNIHPEWGDIKIYLSGSCDAGYGEVEAEILRKNTAFIACLREKALTLVKKVYALHMKRKTQCYAMEQILDFYSKDKDARDHFIFSMETELELIYKHAPWLPKTWNYYNEVLKM